jgi:hypothetical protein
MELNHRQLKIGERTIDVFEPEGMFVGGEVLAEFNASIEPILAGPKPDIRIGCRRMTFMDSQGFGALVSAWSIAKRGGGRLVVDPQGNPRIRKLLEIVRFPFDPDDS